MNSDLAIVFWKEWKEILQRSSGSSGWRPLMVFGVIGILVPLRIGPARYLGLEPILVTTLVSLMAISAIVADAFAGERERHTLETLLASRLPDRAILFGKMAACLAYGWLIAMVTIALGLITINVANWKGQILIYRDAETWLCLMLIPLILGALASAGVLVSLRAPTVRQAQQTLTISLMVVFFGIVFGAGALPENMKSWFARSLAALSPTGVVLVVAAILLCIDLALVLIAMARFQRSNLVLD